MKANKLKDLVRKNRSYRRFLQHHKISKETLYELIDLARLSASGKNQQSLKYFVANEEPLNEQIFKCLAWAGYLKDWDGPVQGEKPSAYIVMLNDTSITKNFFCDDGIAAQSILLGASEMDLGGCIIASVNKAKLKLQLKIPDHLEIIQVLALGKPLEQVQIEEMKNGDFKYWRDEENIHHVPKRALNELVINLL
jgi:nitroreductase